MTATCPSCGQDNDGHTRATGPAAEPSPGDVSLCFYCGTVGIFTEGGAIRLPDAAEAAELDRDPELTALRAALILWHEGDRP